MADLFFSLDINLEVINYIEFQIPEHNIIDRYNYFIPKIRFIFNHNYEKIWESATPIDNLSFGLMHIMFTMFTNAEYYQKVNFYRFINIYGVRWSLGLSETAPYQLITFHSKNANPPSHFISKMRHVVEDRVNVSDIYNIKYCINHYRQDGSSSTPHLCEDRDNDFIEDWKEEHGILPEDFDGDHSDAILLSQDN